MSEVGNSDRSFVQQNNEPPFRTTSPIGIVALSPQTDAVFHNQRTSAPRRPIGSPLYQDSTERTSNWGKETIRDSFEQPPMRYNDNFRQTSSYSTSRQPQLSTSPFSLPGIPIGTSAPTSIPSNFLNRSVFSETVPPHMLGLFGGTGDKATKFVEFFTPSSWPPTNENRHINDERRSVTNFQAGTHLPPPSFTYNSSYHRPSIAEDMVNRSFVDDYFDRDLNTMNFVNEEGNDWPEVVGTLEMEPVYSRHIIINNLPLSYTLETIKQIESLCRQCGHLMHFQPSSDQSSFLFISFFDIRDAKKAISQLGLTTLNGVKLDVRYYSPENPQEGIINLSIPESVPINLEEIRTIFTSFGDIKKIYPLRNSISIEYFDLRNYERAYLRLDEIKLKLFGMTPSLNLPSGDDYPELTSYRYLNPQNIPTITGSLYGTSPLNRNFGTYGSNSPSLSKYPIHPGNHLQVSDIDKLTLSFENNMSLRDNNGWSSSSTAIPLYGNSVNSQKLSQTFHGATNNIKNRETANLRLRTNSSKPEPVAPVSPTTQRSQSPSSRSSSRPRSRPRSRSKKEEDLSKYELDIELVKMGEDTRTTLMIKNIPNKYDQQMLLQAVDRNHKGTYDFFYLPIDFKNKCNVGYAFINFIDPSSIVSFYEEFNQKKWEKFNSEKVCQLKYARIQGKDCMIVHFKKSTLLYEDPKCRPLIFRNLSEGVSQEPWNNRLEPFPAPTNSGSPRPRRNGNEGNRDMISK